MRLDPRDLQRERAAAQRREDLEAWRRAHQARESRTFRCARCGDAFSYVLDPERPISQCGRVRDGAICDGPLEVL
jgi:hypothetical protein